MTDDKLAISRTNELVKAISHDDISEIIKPLVNEIHLFDTFVAGTSFLEDPTVLTSFAVGDRLSLLREENKFDDNAIAVLNEEKKKLGYIPEKDNVVFARLMDAGKMLVAKVGKIDNKGSFMQITIGIYLVDF